MPSSTKPIRIGQKTIVIDANWHRLNQRGPQATLAILKRKYPYFRLYKCYGPGFDKPDKIVTARGILGSIIIEPYIPQTAH